METITVCLEKILDDLQQLGSGIMCPSFQNKGIDGLKRSKPGT